MGRGSRSRVTVMRRLDMLPGRISSAAFGRRLLGGVLSAPSVVRAAAVVVPLISKLESHGSGVHQHRFTFDIRLGLGLAAGAAMLLGQSDGAECMPSKRKGRATVPEVQAEEVTAANILSAPMAPAYPLPQDDPSPPQAEVQMLIAEDATSRKAARKGVTTSRVYEAFVRRILRTAAAAYASQQRTSLAAVHAMKQLARSPKPCGLI